MDKIISESREIIELSKGGSFLLNAKSFLEDYNKSIGNINNKIDSLRKYIIDLGSKGAPANEPLGALKRATKGLNLRDKKISDTAYRLLAPIINEAETLELHDYDGMRKLLERSAIVLKQEFDKLGIKDELEHLRDAENELNKRIGDIKHEKEQLDSKYGNSGGGNQGLGGYIRRAGHEIDVYFGGHSVNAQYEKFIDAITGGQAMAHAESAKSLLDSKLRDIAEQVAAYQIAGQIIGRIYKDYNGVGKKPDMKGIGDEVKALKDIINDVKEGKMLKKEAETPPAVPNFDKKLNKSEEALATGKVVEIMEKRQKEIAEKINELGSDSTEEINKINALVLDYNAEISGLTAGELGLTKEEIDKLKELKSRLNKGVEEKAKQIGLEIKYVTLSSEHTEKITKHLEKLYEEKEEKAIKEAVGKYLEEIAPILTKTLNLTPEEATQLGNEINKWLAATRKRHKALREALRNRAQQQVPQLGAKSST
ncbi:MAG: hypothetical protein QXS17_01870 [Candidatus Micrarchaeaceae archaeon]